MDVRLRVNVGSTASSRLAPPAAAAELLGTIGAFTGGLGEPPVKAHPS